MHHWKALDQGFPKMCTLTMLRSVGIPTSKVTSIFQATVKVQLKLVLLADDED